MSSDKLIVRAGVAVFLFDREGRFVLMLRHGSHGAGTWGLPGGHIEFGESVVDAAAREVREELGVRVMPTAVSDVGWSEAVFHKEEKHYITVLCKAALPEDQKAQVMEPDKCLGLRWAGPGDVLREPLFEPLANYIRRCGFPRP